MAVERARTPEPAVTRRSAMRSHHLIAIAAVLAVGFGVKLFFPSNPTAEANVDAVKSVGMDISKISVTAMLPEQKTHDMTFVFANVD
jgi:hypothetical protein